MCDTFSEATFSINKCIKTLKFVQSKRIFLVLARTLVEYISIQYTHTLTLVIVVVM